MEEQNPRLKPQWQSQAWKQFLMARKEMLDAYDSARNKNLKRRVRTDHGSVAEAAFRKWLTSFLPKKYGVTSGYIVSQGTHKDDYLVHYDVIIYEQLEAPILWMEDNDDASDQGKSLAIPVEYVKGVIEVKSSFNKKTVKDAVRHLGELKPLLQHVDRPQDPIKLYLPEKFFCATVFFELRKENEKEMAALDSLIEGVLLRGFYGGFIMRMETLGEFDSGRLELIVEDKDYQSDEDSLFWWSYSKSKKLCENRYFRIMNTQDESNFARFAFDIIALLKGNYNPMVISSLHGFGNSDMEKGSAVSTRYRYPEDYKAYQDSVREYFMKHYGKAEWLI